MKARVLDGLQLRDVAGVIDPPTGRVGRLLQALLLRPNEVHSPRSLVRLLWPDADDRDGRRRLHVTVSRLRNLLGRHDGDELQLERTDDGYVLRATASSLDRVAFESLAGRAFTNAEPDLAEAALTLWSGEPYAGFPWSAEVVAQRSALSEVREQLQALVDDAGRGDPRPLPDADPRTGNLATDRILEVVDRSPSVGAVDVLAVTGPAGYGKSMFLARWAAQQRAPVGWIQLDSSDNDPARLWPRVVRAVRDAVRASSVTEVDHAEDGALDALDAGGSVASLHEAAGLVGTPIGLVLDSFEVIEADGAIDLVSEIVAAVSGSGTVAIGSRDVLPGRVRAAAADGLHGVTTEDLRLSVEDIEGIGEVDHERAEAVWELTAGWPVAVTAVLRSSSTTPADVAEVAGRFVADEVLSGLDTHVTRFLFQIAQLGTFNSDLCAAVTGSDVGADLVPWLHDRGLIIVDRREVGAPDWIRLHPVVSAVVRARAHEAVPVREIHGRAARWYVDQHMASEALDHAVRAGDRTIIARTARTVLLETALRGEVRATIGWLQAIDPDDLVDDPVGHGIGVYLAALWMGTDDRGRWIRSRLRHFDGDDDPVVSYVHALIALWEGRATESVLHYERVIDAPASELATEAAELLPILIGSARADLVHARLLQGNLQHDDPLLSAAVAAVRPYAPRIAALVHGHWAMAALVDGADDLARWLAAEHYEGRRSLDLSRRVSPDNSVVGALLASLQVSDPGALLALADGLVDFLELCGCTGHQTDSAATLLVLASLCRRGGDAARAAAYEGRADVLMRTFEDAPFLERLREWLASLETPPAHPPNELVDGLTPRQRTILGWLGSDLSNQEIANEVHISVHTLRTHVKAIYRHLDVNSRRQAIHRVGADRIESLRSS